jgi:DNA-directed RNA polymerase
MNWFGAYSGGLLLNGSAFGFPFIRTNQLGLSIAEAHDISKVYAVANNLQHTPWRINAYVYDTVAALVDTGGLDSVLPNLLGCASPPKVWGTREPTVEELRAWKAVAAEAYAKEHSEQSRRIQFFRRFNLAGKLKELPCFYYVWTCDFRGRYNVVQTWVSPQSDDIGKALLRFHRELPATPAGCVALAIHLANEWGNDKCSYGDRIKWVNDHWLHLRQAVANPLDDRWWTQADKPWQFLAAAEEYVSLKLNMRDTHSVPVSADGSCNGFQHLSAMLRDPSGSLAVNLSVAAIVPGGVTGGDPLMDSRPADIYTVILEAVRGYLRASGNTLWDSVLDRKLLKRNVMTSPYSVTLEGMKMQLQEELKARSAATKELMFDARNLAMLVCKAREERLAQAMGAMSWLKYVASECSKRDSPVIWVTPNGFPVMQYYKKYRSKMLDLITGKHRVRLRINVSVGAPDVSNLDKRKQSLGIAPNFVHSMDACHLSMTIIAAHQAGILDFAPVHDSYGTHACNMGALGALLRQQFVSLYQTDVLAELHKSTEGRLGCTLKGPPPKGTFDINEVLKSPHFFNNIPSIGA